MKNNRYCYSCKKEITNCMGFVIVRDLLEYENNKKIKIRELCGKCVFIKEKDLEEFNKELKRFNNV